MDNREVRPIPNSAPDKIVYPNKTDRVRPEDELPEKGVGQDKEYLPDILPSKRER